MTDPWEEASFEGHERAQRRRAAALAPASRLAAVEQMLREAHRAGVLSTWRARKQREVLEAWEGSGSSVPHPSA
jgi:hypothetical protein